MLSLKLIYTLLNHFLVYLKIGIGCHSFDEVCALQLGALEVCIASIC